MDDDFLEIHGIADAEKAMMVAMQKQSVVVADSEHSVLLTLSNPPTAGLTPNRARAIGAMLMEAATRIEKRAADKDKMAHARAAKAAR